MINTRTDLALESKEMYKEKNNQVSKPSSSPSKGIGTQDFYSLSSRY